MAKVDVDIPDKLIKDAAGDKIKKLESDLAKAIRREERAKRKLNNAMRDIELAQNIITDFAGFVDQYKWQIEQITGEY